MYIEDLKDAPLPEVVDKLRSRGFLVFLYGYPEMKERILEFMKRYNVTDIEPEDYYEEFQNFYYLDFQNKMLPLCHALLDDIMEKKGDYYVGNMWSGEKATCLISHERCEEIKYLTRFSDEDLMTYIESLSCFNIIYGAENIIPLLINNDVLTLSEKEGIAEYIVSKIKKPFYTMTRNIVPRFINDKFDEWKILQLKQAGIDIPEDEQL